MGVRRPSASNRGVGLRTDSATTSARKHTAPRFEPLAEKEFRFGTLSDAAVTASENSALSTPRNRLVRVDDELDSTTRRCGSSSGVLHEHLFLTHRFPHPPNKGDRTVVPLLKFLANGRQVHLGTFVDEPTSESSILAVRELTVKAEIVPVGPLRWLNACRSVAFGGSATEGLFQAAG